MTGILRGKTLAEKVYGPGFRPEGLSSVAAPFHGCGIEGCALRPGGSVEMYVDDHPPALDWYTRLLCRLPERSWVRVEFCVQHLGDVGRRSVEELDTPDAWAPWRANPPVFTRPPVLLPELVR